MHGMSPYGPYSMDRAEAVCRDGFIIPGDCVLVGIETALNQNLCITIWQDNKQDSGSPYDMQMVDCIRY